MFAKILLLSTCVALSACGSLPGKYDNALLCTLDCDRAFVASLVGGVGITLELRAQDARELRRLRSLPAKSEGRNASADQK